MFATGRREALLQSLVQEAAGRPSAPTGSIEALRLDVTDPDAIAALRKQILDRTDGAGVHVLINNAGYGHLAPTELVSDDELRAQFETNVFGLMAMTRAFLPEPLCRRCLRRAMASSSTSRAWAGA